MIPCHVAYTHNQVILCLGLYSISFGIKTAFPSCWNSFRNQTDVPQSDIGTIQASWQALEQGSFSVANSIFDRNKTDKSSFGVWAQKAWQTFIYIFLPSKTSFVLATLCSPGKHLCCLIQSYDLNPDMTSVTFPKDKLTGWKIFYFSHVFLMVAWGRCLRWPSPRRGQQHGVQDYVMIRS
jgi:hypothetical protein